MAQNLVISGVQYNDVPKIEVPTADGGTGVVSFKCSR